MRLLARPAPDLRLGEHRCFNGDLLKPIERNVGILVGEHLVVAGNVAPRPLSVTASGVARPTVQGASQEPTLAARTATRWGAQIRPDHHEKSDLQARRRPGAVAGTISKSVVAYGAFAAPLMRKPASNREHSTTSAPVT